MVPVGHQLPGREAQQPGGVGDQTGNGARKQFLGGAVPKEGLLHSRRVGVMSKKKCFYGYKCVIYSRCLMDKGLLSTSQQYPQVILLTPLSAPSDT